MSASAPGWLPDPSGRHEYRYWDGRQWTDDVADGGIASVDPTAGAPAAGAGPGGAGDEATTVIDPTQSVAPAAAPHGSGPSAPAGGPGAPTGDLGPPAGGPSSPFGGPLTPPAGYGPASGYPAPGGEPLRSDPPRRSGPRTGLLIGLGALAVALVVGIVVALAGGDDESSTADPSDAGATGPDSAEPDSTGPDPGDDASDSSLDLGGDIDLGDPDVREAIVDIVADQLEGQGFTRDQAECFTDAMLDGLGADRLADLGESGGDMSALTAEDYSSILDAAMACGVPGLPASPEG